MGVTKFSKVQAQYDVMGLGIRAPQMDLIMSCRIDVEISWNCSRAFDIHGRQDEPEENQARNLRTPSFMSTPQT